jgi:ABC-2 type transport system ATP-binding protein
MHYATTIRNPSSGSRHPALILRPRPVSRRQAPCHSSLSPSPAIVADISVARSPKVPRSETIQQVHVHASVAADANAPDLARTDKPIISARDVVKRYGETIAVAGLDLTIWPGEIFGILGPNGAGKTTTLEMLEGLRAPDAGEMRVAGFDPVTDPDKVHRVIGVQLQSTALFDYLNCAEIIALFAALYGADASPPRVEHLLTLVGLEEKRRSRINSLSGGQQQRLAIALALVNTPRIAFLDEPTTGLDPVARRTLWQTVRDIRAEETTVVLTTHYMEEAEQLCDRIAIMDRGRVVACDTPRALIQQLGADATVRATVQHGSISGEELRNLEAVVAVELRDRDGSQSFDLRTTDAQVTLTALLHLAQRQHITLSGLSTSQASLEEVFLARTGHQYEGDGVVG